MGPYNMWLRKNARYAFFSLLAVYLFFGGSSRVDVSSQIVPQIAAALAIGYAILAAERADYVPYRDLTVFAGLFALLIAIQLVPLPPGLWLSLPGHKLFAEAALIAGEPQPWRPISIAPDLTWAALWGMLPVAAVIALFPLLPVREISRLPQAIVAAALVSAVLGAFQLLSGPDTLLRFYSITNQEFAVGTFANRNHYAVLLAVSLPAFALAERFAARQAKGKSTRMLKLTYRGMAAFVSLSIIVAGSRAGVLVGAGGLALYLTWLFRIDRSGARAQVVDQPSRRKESAFAAQLRSLGEWISARSHLLTGVAIAVVGVTAYFSSRALSLSKLFERGVADDLRGHIVAPMMNLIQDYLPWGSGFGTFVQAFWIAEQEHFLTRRYVNHAHNDWLEFLLEGGLPGALLLAAFIVWIVRKTYVAIRRETLPFPAINLGLYGAFMILCFGIASTPDYPLRTPFLAALFALACMLVSRETVETERVVTD